MPVKIRLARRGRRKAPFYHIIIADGRSPRDGKFIEEIGKYNPLTKPATIELDRDKAFEWLMKGAQPTETARAILRFKGVLYRKHLARGVAKGAMDQEKADQLYQDYIEAKDAKIAERFEQTKQERAAFLAAVSGTPKAVVKEHTAAETESEQFQNVEIAEDAPTAAEDPKAEAPAAEEAKPDAPAQEDTAPAVEEAKAEAPAKEEAKPDAPAQEDTAPAVEEAKAEAPVKEEAKTVAPAQEEPAKEGEAKPAATEAVAAVAASEAVKADVSEANAKSTEEE